MNGIGWAFIIASLGLVRRLIGQNSVSMIVVYAIISILVTFCLIEAMNFGSPLYNRDFNWRNLELRLAFHAGVSFGLLIAVWRFMVLLGGGELDFEVANLTQWLHLAAATGLFVALWRAGIAIAFASRCPRCSQRFFLGHETLPGRSVFWSLDLDQWPQTRCANCGLSVSEEEPSVSAAP